MLSLGQQIGRYLRRIGLRVGDDERLGRAGELIDAYLSVHALFRQNYEDIARAEDLVDLRHLRGAESKRGDSLRATYSKDPLHARHGRGGQFERMHAAVRTAGRRQD